jgi:uncharacterized membrane protein YeaQ/YmgE (transglycosylase-associated protein family)
MTVRRRAERLGARFATVCVEATTMLRGILGVVVGALVWMAAFFTLARLFMFVSPDYAVHARSWMSAHVYDFTVPMSAFNALDWIVAEIVAGWLAVVIARRREAGWVLAAVLGAYLAYQHLYAEWSNLPWWYNLAVAIPAAPAVLLGGKLAAAFMRRPRAVAVI